LGSHYERRPIEEHISTIMEEDKEFSQETTKTCQDKLFAVLEHLEKKAKWRAGLVEIFKKKVTVVVVKTPTKFLLSGRDKRKIFYQLTHLGLKRWIIYIPLELFKEVNLDVKVDLDMFATILNHDFWELRFINRSKNADTLRNPPALEELIASAHELARLDDPFKVMEKLDEPKYYPKYLLGSGI
ncbi:MAG: hypothetical protein MUC39_03855, partial [Candidatus Omnitrophica bacterium]|nr:hypothetical protein [Candidatus Omnitrophota bacterium]